MSLRLILAVRLLGAAGANAMRERGLVISEPMLRPHARRAVAIALVLIALLAGSQLGSGPAIADDGYEPDAQLISDVRGYAQETEKGYDHVLRWVRVLMTLGALEGVTAAEAQGFVDRGWERWAPVAAELQELEAASGDYEPDSQVLADVRGYAQETEKGYEHVLRWMRVLITFGALEGVTVAEARGYADQGWARWIPVAAELALLAASTPDADAETGEDAPVARSGPGEVEGQADQVVKLVGNAQQTKADSGATLGNDHAQPFTAGSNSAGYKLTRVRMVLDRVTPSGNPPVLNVSIRSDASGSPGASLGTLTLTTNGGSLANGWNNFDAASDGIKLEAGATYWMVIDVTTQSSPSADIFQARRTSSKAEDANSADGWSMGDTRLYKAHDATTWTTHSDDVLQFLIRGSAISDATPPALSSAEVDGTTLTLTFDEALDTGSAPVGSAFSVVASTTGTIAGTGTVTLSGATATVTLASAVAAGETVTVSYTAPATSMLRDPAGNNVAGFIDQAVGNNSGAANANSSTTTLVSNTGRSANAGVQDVAQHPHGSAFTTGGNTGGYTLGEVDLRITNWNGNAAHFTAHIYSTTSGGEPDAELYELTNPSTPANNAVNTFKAPAGATLNASTTYSLVVKSSPGNTVRIPRTTSDDEDSGAASGWSIANNRHLSSDEGKNWQTNTAVFMFAIKDTPPSFVSAAVNGATLTLTFDEALDTGSVPAVSAFSVSETQAATTHTIAGTGMTAISGKTVTVTLAARVTTGSTVTVSYTAPTTGPLQDAAGNDVANFTNQSVTNNTPLVGNTGQSVDGGLQVAVTWFAVPFQTGSIAGGYTLSEVGLRMNSWNDKADHFTAQIYSANNSGTEPASNPLYVLTNPAKPTDGAVNTFKAPAGATLDPSTVYFLVVKSSTGNAVQVSRTTSNDEDSGAAIAWVIGNARVQSDDQGSTWTSNAASVLMFAIRAERTDKTVVDLLDFGGGCTQDGCPGTPTGGTAKPGPVHGQITLDWRSASGSTQTSWTVASRESGTNEAFTEDTVTDADTGTYTFMDLDVSKTYDVQVQGVNRVNNVDLLGDWARADGVAPLNIPPPPDTTPPGILSAAVNRTTLTVTFDEALDAASAPAGSAFVVTATQGGTTRTIAGTGTATVSDATVTVTLASAVTEGETVTVTYTKPATSPLRDADRNEVGDLIGWPATNNTDTTPPTVRYIRATGTSVWVAVDEQLFGPGQGVNPPAGSFTVTATPTGGDPRTVTAASANLFGRDIRVDLSASVAAGETVTVTYTKPASNPVRDLAGNEMANFTNQPAYNTVGDTTAPTVSSAAVNEATLTVTFNEELAQWSTPPGNAFTVTATAGGATRTIAGTATAAVSGTTATVTLASAVHPAETVTVAYTKPSTRATRLRDRAHNDVADITSQSVTNNTPADTTAPTFVSASVNGTTLKVVFSEPLDESRAATPRHQPFFYTVDSNKELHAGSLTGLKGDTVTITLPDDTVRHGHTVRVRYVKPSESNGPLRDLAGNRVATILGFKAVTNNTPPAFKSAAVDGAALTVTFDGGLDEDSVPAASAFTVTVGGSAVSLAATNPVAVSGSDVTLTLANAVRNGDTVTVAYAAPGTGAVLQDADNAKNPVPDFTAQTVTNNTPAETTPPALSYMRADGSALEVVWNEPLDRDSQPAASAFSVTTSTTGAIAVSSVDSFVEGNRGLVMTLASAVAADETVTVSYTKPTSNPVRDPAGNEAPGFSNVAAYNITSDTTAPTFSSATVNAKTLKVTLSEELAFWSTTPGSAFSVAGSISGTIAGTATATISGRTATVTLASAVVAGETVTASYTKPGTNSLRDPKGNEVATFAAQAVTNSSPADNTAPTFDSAEVDGRTLTITFSEALDEDSVPSPEDFTVTVSHDIPKVAAGGVAISGDTVTLTLQTPTTHNSVSVYVRYTSVESRPLQDLAGNDVATFKNQRVDNVTPTAGAGVLVDFGGGCGEDTCPDAPTGSALSGPVDGQITVTWTPAATGGVAMRWWVGIRKTNLSADFTETTVAGTARSHTFSGLEATTYDVQVRGRGSAVADVGDAAVATGLTPLDDDQMPPGFSSAAVNRTTLTVTFDEALDTGSAPAGSAFSVTATPSGGSARTITGTGTAAVSGATVTVTLASAVTAADTVTVAYTKPTSNPLQDAAGNPVANFSDRTVTNDTSADTMPPTLSYMRAEGSGLEVVWNEQLVLARASRPAAAAFSVNGSSSGPIAVSSVATSIAGSRGLLLTLASAVTAGEAVTVSYTKPTSNPIQDLAGNEAAGFSNEAAYNITGDTKPPAFSSAAVNAKTLTVTFSEDLAFWRGLAAGSAFSVTATPSGGSARTIAGAATAAISGADVTVTLASAVAAGETVTVGYTKPGTNPLRDPKGNEVATFAAQAVTNNTTAPPSGGPVGGGPVGGGGGGGPRVPDPSDEDFDWNVARDLEALDPDNGQPTGIWSDGELLWVVENASSGPDRVFVYHLADGGRRSDLEFEFERGNRFAHGIWSDGEVVWIADAGEDRLLAYALATGERLAEQDLELAERNRDPRGIWSDGRVMYVLDANRDALFAYDLESGALLAEHRLDRLLNRSPRGIWSDGVTIWISDDRSKRLLAYELDGDELVRNEDLEFSFRSLHKAGNGDPRGIWSDGEVVYVADARDDRVYSYNLPDAIDARLGALSLEALELPGFSPQQQRYELSVDGGISQTTVEAAPAHEGAAVEISPVDADADPQNGHQVALDEETEIEITVTSEDGSRSRVYVIAIARENRAPVAERIPPLELVVGGEPVRLVLGEYFSDPDGDPLRYMLGEPTEAGVVSFSEMDGVLTLTAVGAGETSFELSASDGELLSSPGTLEVTVEAAPSAVGADPSIAPEVRIAARQVSEGRVELALQVRSDDGGWQQLILPQRRFLSATALVDRWRVSTAMEVGADEAARTLRIGGRRLSSGSVEFALLVLDDAGAWSARLLPLARFLPANADQGQWRYSSPLRAETP